jgi:hypothetical protein
MAAGLVDVGHNPNRPDFVKSGVPLKPKASTSYLMRLAIPRAARGKGSLNFSEKSPRDQCAGTSAIALVSLTERANQHGIFDANPIAISRARYQH